MTHLGGGRGPPTSEGFTKRVLKNYGLYRRDLGMVRDVGRGPSIRAGRSKLLEWGLVADSAA